MKLFSFDDNFKEDLICGVDEAGRGALAGPVVSACVILKKDARFYIPDVMDSKKCCEKKRNELFKKIINVCEDYGIGIVDSKKIDEVNILNATMIAMKNAVESLKVTPKLVLIDGNRIPDLKFKTKCVVKGDSKSASIAAASIIAKVTRDEIMKKLDEQYKNYFFKDNKGYGTKKHYESILKYGTILEHRQSFLKKIKDKKIKIQNVSGKIGEKICYSYLCEKGFKVICKNYKSLYGEIDLIAVKGENIYFIEVKLRSDNCGYCPKEAVDLKKQKKIIKTAVCFNQKHKNNYQMRFVVMEVLRSRNSSFSVNFIDNAFYISNEYEIFKDRF